MKLNDVVELIRGKAGTQVRLEVIPADSSGLKTYTITREKIELKDSEAHGQIFEAGKKPDGTPYRIGVIDLPSFYRDMAGQREGAPTSEAPPATCAKSSTTSRAKDVDAVVLDLRLNGGGALSEAISLTGLFIKDGPVVQVKDADKHISRIMTTTTASPGRVRWWC